MPVSDAQKKASVKYLEKLDEVRIRMPKGKKATIQAHAEARSESVNGFINRAIQETMERDNDVLGPSEGRREGSADGDWIRSRRCKGYQRYGPAHQAADQGRYRKAARWGY